jgi:hypothetical protein
MLSMWWAWSPWNSTTEALGSRSPRTSTTRLSKSADRVPLVSSSENAPLDVLEPVSEPFEDPVSPRLNQGQRLNATGVFGDELKRGRAAA